MPWNLAAAFDGGKSSSDDTKRTQPHLGQVLGRAISRELNPKVLSESTTKEKKTLQLVEGNSHLREETTKSNQSPQ